MCICQESKSAELADGVKEAWVDSRREPKSNRESCKRLISGKSLLSRCYYTAQQSFCSMLKMQKCMQQGTMVVLHDKETQAENGMWLGRLC